LRLNHTDENESVVEINERYRSILQRVEQELAARLEASGRLEALSAKLALRIATVDRYLKSFHPGGRV
jgi:hypothetical protein